MHDYDLLVVGSVNADLVIGVDRRPGPGETVLGSDLVTHPGGKGANQAAAAARLGARTALLARIGDDAHGRLLMDAQRADGVDTTGVLVGGAPTGVALITVDPTGDNSIVVSPGANGRLTPQDIRAAGDLFAAARVVSTQLEIPLDTVAEAAASLAPGARFVLNPSPPAPLPDGVLAACDPLVVNEHEARVILGGAETGLEPEAGQSPEAGGSPVVGEKTVVGDSPEDWADALLALGPRSVVITLGSEGALTAEAASGTKVLIPSVKVRAVDTTGAGDSFTAALAWRLGLGEDLPTAVAFAVRVGAAAVTKEGAQASFPTLAEVEALGGPPADGSGPQGPADGPTDGPAGQGDRL